MLAEVHMADPDLVSWFDDHWLPAFTAGATRGFHALSPRDRVLALVGAVFDHLIGAGLRVLYEGPAGAHTATLADSFEAIGARRVAELLRDFDRNFPGGAPSPNQAERQRQIDELPNAAWAPWDEIGELFEECAANGERVLLIQLHDWYHAQPR
jgi:hypothetical protein